MISMYSIAERASERAPIQNANKVSVRQSGRREASDEQRASVERASDRREARLITPTAAAGAPETHSARGRARRSSARARRALAAASLRPPLTDMGPARRRSRACAQVNGFRKLRPRLSSRYRVGLK